ncbi:MAG TPA: oxidoreductase [Oceanospirillaceae bacterium]|nr:oxidoreductase [Oceanospirillaceae bacterium]
MSQLFSPITIKSVTMRNRVGAAPMCQYHAINGIAQTWHQAHIGALAMGGAGLIIMEATGVRADGRITPYCLGLWNEEQVAALKPIVAFAKQQGATMGIQLAHAGRKASSARPWLGGQHLEEADGGWPTLGPSAMAFDTDGTRLWKTPIAMEQADIDDIQQCFADAAQRALASGFEFIEIHGAHGYLLHSFLSPLTNQRQDQYGGSLQNRARMLLETVAKVQRVWPQDLPLGVRLSMTDWVAGGLTLADTVQVSAWLKDAGVDIVDCSTGGATPESRGSINGGIATQPSMAGEARRQTGILTMAVGDITAAQQAEGIIQDGSADMVLLARQLLRDPYWPRHAAKELDSDVAALMPDLHKLFIGKNP